MGLRDHGGIFGGLRQGAAAGGRGFDERTATMGELIKRPGDGKLIGWYSRYYDADGTRRIRASKQPTSG